VEWIDLEPAYTVLEEDCAKSEVGVRINAGVLFVFESTFENGHIMKEPKLWIGSLHIAIEKCRLEVQDQCQCTKHVESEFVTSLRLDD
jgi:hypothetical protein